MLNSWTAWKHQGSVEKEAVPNFMMACIPLSQNLVEFTNIPVLCDRYELATD